MAPFLLKLWFCFFLPFLFLMPYVGWESLLLAMFKRRALLLLDFCFRFFLFLPFLTLDVGLESLLLLMLSKGRALLLPEPCFVFPFRISILLLSGDFLVQKGKTSSSLSNQFSFSHFFLSIGCWNKTQIKVFNVEFIVWDSLPQQILDELLCTF